jgi:hypothetical protein
MLTNRLTGDSGEEQPWKRYYKGMKPKNPLGGNIVRRMGNKVKPVLSTSSPAQSGKTMQFHYVGKLASFAVLTKEEFLKRQKLAPQLEQEDEAESPVSATDVAAMREKRLSDKDKRDRAKEIRGRVNSARGLSQEVRGWYHTLTGL